MITVISNINKFRRDMAAQQKKFDRVLTKTVNRTALGARKDLIEELPKKLDRPTPFTQKAFLVKQSKVVKRPSAVILTKDIQEGYLQYAVFGGERKPKGKSIPVPFENLKLNKYGNMPRRKIKNLLTKKKNFRGVVKGIYGIWQRIGGKRNRGVKLLVGFEPKTQYGVSFDFFEIVEDSVAKRWERNYSKAFRQIMET